MISHSWMNSKVMVKKSKKHGNGIFAEMDIRNGETLVYFGGYIMPIENLHLLPIDLRPFPMQIDEHFILTSQRDGVPEDVDFINHSCEPNCGFFGQIQLVAMRDIKEDEEITFDYAMVTWNSPDSVSDFKMMCNCGSKKCRKIITGDDWKLPELRKRYQGFFSCYIQQKIDNDPN